MIFLFMGRGILWIGGVTLVRGLIKFTQISFINLLSEGRKGLWKFSSQIFSTTVAPSPQHRSPSCLLHSRQRGIGLGFCGPSWSRSCLVLRWAHISTGLSG